jgi:hypothetical protein
MATIGNLENLQDGLSASLQILLKAYDECTDPAESAALLIQAKQLAAQMSQIETSLFHQQTVQAGAVVDPAFSSAESYTADLKNLAGKYDQISDIIAAGAKLVEAVTVIVGGLSL